MSGWRVNARRTLRLGPLFAVITAGGAKRLWPRLTSWGVLVGRFRHNVTTGTTTVDTPGPGSISRRKGR